MILIGLRLFFVLLSAAVGYYFAILFEVPDIAIFTLIAGAVVGALVFLLLEAGLRRGSIRVLSSIIFGLAVGLVLSRVVTSALVVLTQSEEIRLVIQTVLTLVFCYLGMVLAFRAKDELNMIIPFVSLSPQGPHGGIIILDTSVIIDGRIADICDIRFLEGRIIIPRFVLKELQQIADSADALKRNRGRRGLDVLNRLQKNASIDVKIRDEDFPEIREVDAKLVKMAKMMGAKVVTNDFNLNKVAEIEGVPVLNINELANALKPVVLPGELMEVRLIKEGKEYNQAVAYLDDGTMVVVENGRPLIGRTLRVMVSSVLQTQAGKMIFAKLQQQSQRMGTGRGGR
jgi:uncharacterized protein YacL